MKRVIIDRLEEATAVCFDEISLLPKGADEGCTLLIDDNGGISLDLQDTRERAARIKALEDQLFK